MADSIEKRVNLLFEEKVKLQDWVPFVLEKLEANYREAIKNVRIRIFYLLSIWLITFLIGKGLVIEAQLWGIKLSKLQLLLIVSLPITGFVYYLLSTSLYSVEILEEAIAYFYKNWFPTFYANDMQNFIGLPYFRSVENEIMKIETGKLSTAFQEIWIWVFFGIGIILLGLVVLIHSAIILFTIKVHPVWLIVISLIIGLFFAFRAVLVFFVLFKHYP